jgi:hypothetical protein
VEPISQHDGSDLPDLICLGLPLNWLQVDDLFNPLAGEDVVISFDTFREPVMSEHFAEGIEEDGVVPLFCEDVVENLPMAIHSYILAQGLDGHFLLFLLCCTT